MSGVPKQSGVPRRKRVIKGGVPKKKVCLTRKKFLSEHTHLVGLLDKVASQLKREAQDQSEELRRVKKRRR